MREGQRRCVRDRDSSIVWNAGAAALLFGGHGHSIHSTMAQHSRWPSIMAAASALSSSVMQMTISVFKHRIMAVFEDVTTIGRGTEQSP